MERDMQHEDQQACDIANEILRILIEKRTTVEQSLWALNKAKIAIELSTRSASWGSPLFCDTAPEGFYV